MHLIWRIAAGVPAGLFLVVGLAWLLAPDFVSARMRMPLLEGEGLSTQIGDLAAFFLTLGGSIAIALWTQRALWLYPAILLLALAAAGRMIAWLGHGAGLPLDMILAELVLAGLLLLVARKMAPSTGRSEP